MLRDSIRARVPVPELVAVAACAAVLVAAIAQARSGDAALPAPGGACPAGAAYVHSSGGGHRTTLSVSSALDTRHDGDMTFRLRSGEPRYDGLTAPLRGGGVGMRTVVIEVPRRSITGVEIHPSAAPAGPAICSVTSL